MAGLTNKSIASAYKSLLRVDDDTNGIDTAAEFITDGEGTKSALKLSDDVVQILPQNDDTTTTFAVKSNSGTTLLTADTTNSVIKAGVGQFNVLNNYAYFGITSTGSANYLANEHYAICFGNETGASAQSDISFGTGTDPADTFTTSDTTDFHASNIVPMMWFVPDNIAIDSVTSIEGANQPTGDTTRMHLKSFTFTSGSTSCLTAGELLAHNSDVTNAGNEQAYKTTWTVDQASVTGGKVILAFFRQDSDDSDYSLSVVIKYHLV